MQGLTGFKELKKIVIVIVVIMFIVGFVLGCVF